MAFLFVLPLGIETLVPRVLAAGVDVLTHSFPVAGLTPSSVLDLSDPPRRVVVYDA